MKKHRYILLASLVVALVLGMGIAPAAAYFTDSSTTNGGLPISVKPGTDIKEWYASSLKEIEISNDQDADAPVFVRARAYSTPEADVETNQYWFDGGDGWYYYGTSADALTPLAPGESTSRADGKALNVHINWPEIESEDEPDGAVFGDNFNVIVVYESTPVLYEGVGDEARAYADWSFTLDNGTSEGGN